jgi:uncharacterized membrane protein YedE/YeeE
VSEFTPLSGLLGGMLIGLGAALFAVLNGRIAGISGVLGGLAAPSASDTPWRIAFLAGLLLGPWIASAAFAIRPDITVTGSPMLLIAAGLLVGFGTRLGNGCTSGHGVCGLARGSRRSLAATVTFFLVAVAMVFVMRRALGR